MDEASRHDAGVGTPRKQAALEPALVVHRRSEDAHGEHAQTDAKEHQQAKGQRVLNNDGDLGGGNAEKNQEIRGRAADMAEIALVDVLVDALLAIAQQKVHQNGNYERDDIGRDGDNRLDERLIDVVA